MAKKEGQHLVEELENYLSSSYLNRVIYHRLTRGDRAGLFGPLDFIIQLRGLYSYAIANRHSPSILIERLSQIDLTDAQKSFLLHYLDILFFEDSIRNTIERQLHPAISAEETIELSYQAEILVEWAKMRSPVDDLAGYRDSHPSLVRDYYSSKKPGSREDLVRMFIADSIQHRLHMAMRNRYDFNRVRQHLDTLPDNETKIAYLIEIKTEYLQVDAISGSGSERFDKKCETEKAKLKGLLKIAKPRKLRAFVQNDQATNKKVDAPQREWSEEQYLIRAVPAAKAIGRRGNNLTDERMAEEMECSRGTALKYRRKYSTAYNITVRSGHEEGLKEYSSNRNKT